VTHVTNSKASAPRAGVGGEVGAAIKIARLLKRDYRAVETAQSDETSAWFDFAGGILKGVAAVAALAPTSAISYASVGTDGLEAIQQGWREEKFLEALRRNAD
jgi:hypothetical protein